MFFRYLLAVLAILALPVALFALTLLFAPRCDSGYTYTDHCWHGAPSAKEPFHVL
jgi:hypothetical protein